MYVQELESETISDFINAMAEYPDCRTLYEAFGPHNSVVRMAGCNGKYIGAITSWPTDRTEIVITGSLPSYNMWANITASIELVR